MKINLHCHTQYSDGAENVSVLAIESKNLGACAFVATDHVYPHSKYRDSSITDIKKYKRQTRDLKSISNYIGFPCLQGIELSLYWEEVLVFGNQVIYEIFKFMDNKNSQGTEEEPYDWKLNDYLELIDLLLKYKKNSAYIMCHPALHNITGRGSHLKVYYEKLFSLVDGYERENSGVDMFSNRAIPEELKNKKAFYNSDAHLLVQLGNFKNECEKEITSIDELITYIKK